MKKVGLIFAMEEELNEFKKKINITNQYNIFDLSFYEGVINNVKCILSLSGIGKVNSARCAQILIDNMDVTYVINIGVGGALRKEIKVCDLVIGSRLVQHDFDITAFDHKKGYIPNVGIYIDSDDYLVKIAKECINLYPNNVYCGTIASGDIFCTEKKMSEKISDKFDALCVEMEGASIAQVCYLSHVPFIVIRSISDNGDGKVTYEDFLKKSSVLASKFLYDMIAKL